MTKCRRICEIAEDIKAAWPKPYFGAVPYIEAMRRLSWVTEFYGMEPADSIINRFLANASTFRGEKARELKAELKCHLVS